MSSPQFHDGWEEDDDDVDLGLDDDDMLGTNTGRLDQSATAVNLTLAASQRSDDVVEDGWGDLDDVDDLADDNKDDSHTYNYSNNSNTNHGMKVQSSQVPIPQQKSAPDPSYRTEDAAEDAWGDDDDLLNLDVDDDGTLQDGESKVSLSAANISAAANRSAVDARAAQQLMEYLDLIPLLLPSVNAILEAEYNTPEKAAELIQYYSERPGLVQYTLDKELPRMEYRIVETTRAVPAAPVVWELKDQLAQRLAALAAVSDPKVAGREPQGTTVSELAVRCANQSILADLLQVMTGPDRLIRPQFMAAAVAHTCQYTLRLNTTPSLAGPHSHHPETVTHAQIQVQAILDLILPTSTTTLPSSTATAVSQGRWKVAEIHVHIFFVPDELDPVVEYRLTAVHPAIRDDAWKIHCQGAIDWLAQHGDELQAHLHETFLPPNTGGGYGPYGPSSSTNFRDAFLQQSQNILANSTEGIKTAWKEIEAVAGLGHKLSHLTTALQLDAEVWQAAEREQELAAAAASRVQPKSSSTTGAPQRPTSILGGLVRSGWQQLAKTVTLPDEDPSLYEEWQPPHRPTPATRPPTMFQEDDSQRQGPRQQPKSPTQGLSTQSSQQHLPSPHIGSSLVVTSVAHLSTSSIVATAGGSAKSQAAYHGQQVSESIISQVLEAELPTLAQSMAGLHDGWDDPLEGSTDDDAEVIFSEEGEHYHQINPDTNTDQEIVFDYDDHTGDKVGLDLGRPIEETKLTTIPARDGRFDGPVAALTSSAPYNFESPDRSSKVPEPSIETRHGKNSSNATSSTWVYDPVDDIIPTRKRWVNPRPGPRHLSSWRS